MFENTKETEVMWNFASFHVPIKRIATNVANNGL